MRHALYEAERQLEDRMQAPFANLQQWLQFTYEVETKYFEEKRHTAEKQLMSAKDMVGYIRYFFMQLLSETCYSSVKSNSPPAK